MTRPDRERLRAWDRATAGFKDAMTVKPPPHYLSKAAWRAFQRTMADCQLAGFATPMEVARGGRA